MEMRIKKLKQGYSEKNLIFFDVETSFEEKDDFILQHFKLAVIKRGNHSKTVFSEKDLTKELLDLCVKRKRKGEKRHTVQNLVFAHNADFDFRFLDWDMLLEEYDLVNKSMQPFFVELVEKTDSKRKKSIVFLDSMNWFRDSLKNLGKMFGLPKGDIDFETCSMKELETYCIRDVDILEKAILFLDDMHRNYDIRWTVSIAQMAYRIFRKDFLKYDLFCPDKEDIIRLERDSYKGGRVEVFDTNIQPKIWKYDINSLYPSVMKNIRVPVKIINYFNKLQCREFNINDLLIKLDDEISKGNLIIARCRIIEDDNIPIASVRLNGKLVFPNGAFETVLTTYEFERLREKILSVSEYSVYEGDYLFKDFVDEFYSLRKHAKNKKNDVLNWFYKIILNSLYGKFGQRRFDFERIRECDGFLDFGIIEHIDDETLENHHVHIFNGKAFLKTTDEINPRAFVAIASHITSYARLILWQYLKENKKTVVYCDTDSVFLNRPRNDYNDDKTLGKMKYEGILETFQAFGAKDYVGTFKGDIQRKLKGVPKSAKQIGKNTFQYNKILKHRETIRRYKDFQVRQVKVVKNLTREYDKREVEKDGSTRPVKI